MNIRHFARIACVAALSLAGAALAREPSPAGAEVYIVSPKDGATVKSPVTVVFGLKGMGIAPAGIKFDNTGHHHLLDRQRAAGGSLAAARRERKERAFRQGPDRNLADAAARQTHPATGARRFAAHSARPGGGLEEDHYHCRKITAVDK